MHWLAWVIGPVMGAVIGYLTNFIAVKLMFRPLKSVYIGRFHVPLTPGIIPRRQQALGRAIGQAVGQTLLTPQDIERMLRSEVVVQTVCNETLVEFAKVKDYQTLGQVVENLCGQERYERSRDAAEHFLAQKIIAGAKKIDLEELLLSDGGAAIKEQMKGTFMALLVSEETLRLVAKPLTVHLHAYMDSHGEEVLLPLLREEIDNLANANTGDVLDRLGLDEEHVRQLIIRVYESVILKKIADIVRHFDFEGMVEDKVNEMDVEEVERLVLSVMEKELNTLINLGAYIGFIIGFLDPLISFLIGI